MAYPMLAGLLQNGSASPAAFPGNVEAEANQRFQKAGRCLCARRLGICTRKARQLLHVLASLCGAAKRKGSCSWQQQRAASARFEPAALACLSAHNAWQNQADLVHRWP